MDSQKKIQTLFPYLRNYGKGCLSYSTLQEGLEYFVLEGIGYIAYLPFKHFFFTWGGRNIALANPICSAENYKDIISAFIKEKGECIFVQYDERLIPALSELGLDINQFGIETNIPINNFSLSGKERSKLRQWKNKCEREGVTVSEEVLESKVKTEIGELSRAWIKNKGNKEIGFLARPFMYEREPDVRYFVARKNNEIIAFAGFDPIYQANKTIGYYHNFDRMKDDAPNGVGVFIILEALKVFNQENIQFISLGMSPAYKIKKHPRQQDFVAKSLRYAYKKLNFLYPFKGNASHKAKFNGEQVPIYFTSTKGNGLREIFVTLKAINLI